MIIWTNPKRLFATAFVIGALVHALLLGVSLTASVLSDAATWLLLVFALPGAIVDMSAEMMHPSQWGGVWLTIVATIVNGGAYVVGAWMAMNIRNRLRPTGSR